jgi:hypothetical protein
MFIYFYSATPGHRFLYMQVITDKHNRPDLMQILFRSAFKFQGILFFCIPFVEIILRTDRTTFYDRLAQTKLVSLRQTKHDEIHPEFRKIVLRWAHTAIIFSFLVIGLIFYKTVSKGQDHAGASKTSLKCTESLTQHLKNYLSKSKESENLNCSRDLVEKTFNSKKPATAVNYLAQYIVTPMEELKESYRAKYCQSAAKKLLCQPNAAIDFANAKPDDEDVLNLLVEMNTALVKNDHARVFTILDVLYSHVDWNRNLELYYMTSYVFLTERSDRAPASERKQQEEWLAKKARFLKRMSVVL